MREIAWLRKTSESQLELYIRDSFTDGQWVHYTAHRLKQPDTPIPNGSKGFATMQHLLSVGYRLVPSGGVVDAPKACDGTCGVKPQ